MSEYTDYNAPLGEEQHQEIPPIPVHIASYGSTPIRPVSPEFGTCVTWSVDTLANMGQPLRLLTRRYRRTKAKIIISNLGPFGAAAGAQGTQAAPAANTQICVIAASTVVPGWYMIKWNVNLSGTTGAPEEDNFQLRLGASTLDTSSNPGAAGSFPQSDYGPVYINNQGVAIRSGTNVATAASVYGADVQIVPVNAPPGGGNIILNSHQEQLMQPTAPAGAIIATAPITIEWENQNPLYAVVAPGGNGPVQVAVVDQAYEET